MGGRFEFTGKVIGLDEEVDLAVIKVNATGKLPMLGFGDSDMAEVGDDVAAIGFPISPLLGDAVTVTKGIVSSIRRYGDVEYLQTDAAINPGNSGGPLVNGRGEVVGVNTARVEEVFGRPVQNIGLAIAANTVKEVLSFLKAGGMVRAAPTLTPTPEPNVVYTSETYLYTIEVPPGWRIDTSARDQVVTWYPGTGSAVWVHVWEVDLGAYPTLGSYVAASEIAPAGNWDNFEIVSEDRVQYGPFEAHEFVYRYDYAGEPHKGIADWYLVGKYLVQVSAVAEERIWIFQEYSDVRKGLESVIYGMYSP